MTPIPPASERHARSRAAYLRRDLEAYMAPFAKELRYHQANGRQISREVLAHQVADQFRRVSAADWTFQIEQSEVVGDLTIETGTQLGWIAATAFGYLHRLWRLERKGRYSWREGLDGWQIVEVVILSEQVARAGFQIGRKPRLPTPAPTT